MRNEKISQNTEVIVYDNIGNTTYIILQQTLFEQEALC